ncbi:hypothetical protein LMG28138_05747 [Pararobbsia alpina]|uniref:Uncharacterized protein n=1 Tax=Pararobbsia alpina TaxID=621374 RepID=A0A6S7D414_9BURK|nr:hypothetical protein LMG28138_05747 [Pararobbsia alpina]
MRIYFQDASLPTRAVKRVTSEVVVRSTSPGMRHKLRVESPPQNPIKAIAWNARRAPHRPVTSYGSNVETAAQRTPILIRMAVGTE